MYTAELNMMVLPESEDARGSCLPIQNNRFRHAHVHKDVALLITMGVRAKQQKAMPRKWSTAYSIVVQVSVYPKSRLCVASYPLAFL